MTDEHQAAEQLPVPHEEQAPPALYVYLRTGEPMGTLAGGAVAVEDALVAYTVLQDMHGGTVRISTAFLGVDASLGMEPQPLLWETVISGGPYDRGLYRYPTEAEALVAHAQVVSALADGMVAPSAPAESASSTAPIQDTLSGVSAGVDVPRDPTTGEVDLDAVAANLEAGARARTAAAS